MTQFHSITDALALAVQSIYKEAPVVEVIPPADRIMVVDVSGSMYGELSAIRKHLKETIKKVLKVQDTLTLIWFSSRNEYGIAFERELIHSMEDLSHIFALIDKALTPRGLTGFTGPLNEVKNVVKRIRDARSDSLVTVFFMSDGYDNQGTKSEILSVCSELEKQIDNAILVEYGWYCDHDLMSKMAEKLGGTLLFSKQFKEYSEQMDMALAGSKGARKKPIQLEAKPVNGYVFYDSESGPVTVAPDETNTVWLPESVTSVAYFTEKAGTPQVPEANPLYWLAMAVLAQKGEGNLLFTLLRYVGDVALVNLYTNCFSKEDMVIFKNDAYRAVSMPEARYMEGYDPNAVPADDAFTVLDMIALLSMSDENLLYVQHPAFSYKRIGAAREAVEQEGGWTPKFEITNKERGYPLNGIVWSDSRPNVSIRVVYEGTVALPDNRPAVLPEVINTYTYRNYTIIKDGIVHTRVLPMSLNQYTHEVLLAEGIVKDAEWAPGKIFILEFPRTPVINRKMVEATSSKAFFSKVMEMEVLKGAQKVYNDLRKALAPKRSEGFEAAYGEEATKWLKEVAGITEFNGFSPSSTTVKSGDVYPTTEFKIAVKGLSSLPKVADVQAAVASGKTLKVGEFVMSSAVKEIEAFKKSPVYLTALNKDEVLEAWAKTQSEALVQQVRQLMLQIAQQKFCIMVGHAWFTDAPEYGVAQQTVDIPGFGGVQVTANLKDVNIEL